MDYGDVIYDQLNNHGLLEKIGSVQYNAALAITGTVRLISKVKLYQELGLESLKYRKWVKRPCYLHKVVSIKLPL